jgi:hypothetical protein
MEFISGNIFIRKMMVNAPKGHIVEGHTHNFDHTTIVFQGAVHVRATLPDGRVIEHDFHAPNHLLIRKDVTHEITALEDGTECWCVYSHRTPQGEVTQIDTGWPDGYV